MTNDSIKLAQLWIDLREMKNKLDDDIIPVSGHLRIDDDELINAMELLSERIGEHFDRFRLLAENQERTS